MNVFKIVLPQAVVTGYYYHYNRTVWKKGCDLKENNEIIRLSSNLPLLLINYIEADVKSIVKQIPKHKANNKYNNQIINYFERKWPKSFPLICDI